MKYQRSTSVSVLHIGKLPPPIGGISIHLKRLLEGFEYSTIKMELLDYSKEKNLLVVLKKIKSNRIVHVHLSRKMLRLAVIILFRCLFKKVVVTFHGEYDFKNKYDLFSLKLTNYAILLNNKSYNAAKEYKQTNLSLLSAFIAPPKNEICSLSTNTITDIHKFRSTYNYLFCTNAWNVVFDKDGNEIYGGSLLIEIFSKISNVGLIFSDPKANYKDYLIRKYSSIPNNILFIDYLHDYVDVIEKCDASLRATTTDGDSLSVHEALFLKKDVVASDVVNRPNGTILYRNSEELESIISNFQNYKNNYKRYNFENIKSKLENVYINL